MKTWKLLAIVAIIALLYFHYPLMALRVQPGDAFALTTSKGPLTIYSADINSWFINDIRSVQEKPGLFLYDSIIYEYKDRIIPLQGSLPFLMHAFLLNFLSPTNTLLAGLVISTAITIALLLWFTSKLKSTDELDILLIAMFYTLPHIIFDIPRLLAGSEFLPYTGFVGRFINTNHNVIFYLLWFLALFICLEKPKEKPWKYVLVGIGLAVLQYSYVFYWTAGLVFTAFALWFRNSLKIDLGLIKKYLYVYGTWLILIIPYIINYFKYHALNKELLIKAGSQNWSSEIILFELFLIALGILLAVLIYVNYASSNKNRFDFLSSSYLELSLFSTMAILLNLHYILGYSIQPIHWVWTFMTHTVILLVFMRMTQVYSKFKKKKLLKATILVIAALLIILNAAKLYSSANTWQPHFTLSPEDQQLFSYVSTLPKDVVLFTDSGYFSDVIRSNTGRRTLLGMNQHSVITKEEIHQRLLQGYEAMNITRQELYTQIEQCNDFEPKDTYEAYPCFYYYEYYSTNFPLHDAKAIISDLEKARPSSYKLDYVIYTRDLSKVINPIFKNGKYAVVKVRT